MARFPASTPILCAIIMAVAILGAVALATPAGALDAGKLGLPGAARPAPPPAPPSTPRAGMVRENRDAIAVIIGNRHYAHGLPEVRYAENDAEAVRRFVVDVLGYRDGNVIDLRNASQAEMLSVFGNASDHRGKLWSWIRTGVSDLFVYYSGHGVPGLGDRRGYLLPVDADPATPAINGYPLDLLLSNLARLDARSTMVMIDACFSGGSAAGWLIPSASPVYVRTEAPADPGGMVVVTAARGDQVASWDDAARQGLFTRHMLDALAGGAADRAAQGNGDGTVTLGELEAYLDDAMTYAARRLFRRVQQATVLGDPATVLLDQVRPQPRPAEAGRMPARRVPAGPIAAAPPAADRPGLGAPASIGEAEAFLAANWETVRQEIVDYYARTGSAWDLRGNPPHVEFAETMRSIDGHEVVAAGEGRVDVAIRYRWRGGNIEDSAAATVRLVVAPDGVSVERMWR